LVTQLSLLVLNKDTDKAKHLDDIPRTKEIKVKFTYKTKFDS